MSTPVFYFGGHVDDAMLFHGEFLYQDLHDPTAHVHSIVPDAADQGWADGWQGKEAGHLAALAASCSPGSVTHSRVLINGHKILRYTAGQYSVWFLRLPDGGLDGNGYPLFGNTSLQKLQAGAIGSLPTVDGSTTYTSWEDYAQTLRGITHSVTGWQGSVINCSDFDRALNPGDHPDHYATADAINEWALADKFIRSMWVSYDTVNRPANMPDGPDLDAKWFVWRNYGWTAGAPNMTEWDWWGNRSYYRVLRP